MTSYFIDGESVRERTTGRWIAKNNDYEAPNKGWRTRTLACGGALGAAAIGFAAIGLVVAYFTNPQACDFMNHLGSAAINGRVTILQATFSLAIPILAIGGGALLCLHLKKRYQTIVSRNEKNIRNVHRDNGQPPKGLEKLKARLEDFRELATSSVPTKRAVVVGAVGVIALVAIVSVTALVCTQWQLANNFLSGHVITPVGNALGKAMNTQVNYLVAAVCFGGGPFALTLTALVIQQVVEAIRDRIAKHKDEQYNAEEV